jgi:AraC family transcriptional activator of pobA
MDEHGPGLYLSGLKEPPMPASVLVIPYREVRHLQPDDCLHWEPIEYRGRLNGWNVPPHCHEALHQFNFLESGTVEATFDGTVLTLAAPAVWMVAPGVMHGLDYAPESTGQVVSLPAPALREALRLSPALAVRLSGALVADPAFVAREAGELRDLFGKIAREFGAARPGRAEALQAHAALLALWFARCEGAAPDAQASRRVQDALVDRFRALLEAKFCEHWPVRAYAAALHVSADHLSRRCRAVTGLSALELIQERLLLEARRLLAYTDRTVAQIAHALGFEDPAYFSRVFAKQAGESPVAYRAAIAQGVKAAPANGASS